jgi:hypothetical protein
MKRIALSIIITAILCQPAFSGCVTNEGHLASPSKEVIKKSAEYAASRDFEAFKSLLSSGQAFTLKGGMQVNIVDRTFGMVKFRPRGKTTEVWAQSNAVDCR